MCHFIFQQKVSYQKWNKLHTKPYKTFPTMQKEANYNKYQNDPKWENAHN